MTALPAGPEASPLVQTVAYQRDPLGVLRRARTRFGPVFTLRFVWKGPVVFVADPGAVPRLLDSDPDAAQAGEARRTILPQASPRSPFGADAAQHRATRGRMEPAFSADAMARAEPPPRSSTSCSSCSWAAQEPPSIAMTKVVNELARHPGAGGAAEVAEALHLRPAAQAALWRLTAPESVAGHELPAGTVVALPSLLLHRDPRAFPEPDAFHPERFADGEPPAAGIPFGAR